MRNILLVIIGFDLFSVARAQQEMPAGHPPLGYGVIAKGGEGGRMIAVTTLNDSGPGSLREALAFTGPRIIRFAVEGTIELANRLLVTEGRVTIDGSTAPGNSVGAPSSSRTTRAEARASVKSKSTSLSGRERRLKSRMVRPPSGKARTKS